MEMFECGDSGETMLEVGSVSHCLFSSKKLFIYCGRNSGPIILLAKSVSSEAVNSCHYVDEALLGGDKRGKRVDPSVCSLNVSVIVILISFVMPYLLITLILQGHKSLGVCFKNEKLSCLSNCLGIGTDVSPYYGRLHCDHSMPNQSQPKASDLKYTR